MTDPTTQDLRTTTAPTQDLHTNAMADAKTYIWPDPMTSLGLHIRAEFTPIEIQVLTEYVEDSLERHLQVSATQASIDMLATLLKKLEAVAQPPS